MVEEAGGVNGRAGGEQLVVKPAAAVGRGWQVARCEASGGRGGMASSRMQGVP